MSNLVYTDKEGLHVEWIEHCNVLYEAVIRNGKIKEITDCELGVFIEGDKEASDYPNARQAMASYVNEAPAFYRKVRTFVPSLWPPKQAREFLRNSQINDINKQIDIHLKQIAELQRARKKLEKRFTLDEGEIGDDKV